MLYGELCIEAEQNKIFSAGKCGCTISFGRRLILTCSGRKSLPDVVVQYNALTNQNWRRKKEKHINFFANKTSSIRQLLLTSGAH